jgi:hypothetical protein
MNGSEMKMEDKSICKEESGNISKNFKHFFVILTRTRTCLKLRTLDSPRTMPILCCKTNGNKMGTRQFVGAMLHAQEELAVKNVLRRK